MRCLRQLHQALLDDAETFRALTTAEVGMPAFMQTAAGFDVPVEGLGWVADLRRATSSRPTSASRRRWASRARRTVRREPVGVVAAITPWNVPTQINLAKVGPALAAGCTVVLKPAPDTPWVAAELGRLVAEHTDIPPGVLNVVTPRVQRGRGAAHHRPARRHGVVHRLDRRSAGRSWPRPRRR